MATLLLVFTLLACLVAIGSRRELRYPNGTSFVSNGAGEYAAVHWQRVAEHGRAGNGKLVHAFVAHPNLAVTTSHSRDTPTIPSTGLFYIANLPNQLWLDGRKIELPEDFELCFILEGGSVRKIGFSETECDALCRPQGNTTNKALWQELTAFQN